MQSFFNFRFNLMNTPPPAVGNMGFVIIAGGSHTSSAVPIATRTKYSLQNGSSITQSNLAVARTRLMGTSNTEYGLFVGGLTNPFAPTFTNYGDKIKFSDGTETSFASASALAEKHASGVMFGNIAQAMSLGGDYDKAGTIFNYTTLGVRYGWSEETAIATDAFMDTGFNTGAMAGTQEKTLFTGTNDAGNTNNDVAIRSYSFSNEVHANNGSFISLISIRHSMASLNNFVDAYFLGGRAPGALTTYSQVVKTNFANNAISNVSNSLATPVFSASGNGNNLNGYVFGGNDTADVTHSTVQRLDYSDGTQHIATALGSNLTDHATATNTPSGWFDVLNPFRGVFGTFASEYALVGGGTVPGQAFAMTRFYQKFGWAEGTTFPQSTCLNFQSNPQSASTINLGYIYGSFSNPNQAERYDFNNDVFIVSAGSLAAPRSEIAITGNDSFAIMSGGIDSVLNNKTDKYSYATDTTSVGTAAPYVKGSAAAVSNMEQANFVAGRGGASTVKTVSRYRYSDNTHIAVGDSVVGTRKLFAGSGNESTAFFKGGVSNAAPQAPVANGERFGFIGNVFEDYSVFANARNNHSSSSSTFQIGWFGGNDSVSGANVGSIDIWNIANSAGINSSSGLSQAQLGTTSFSSKPGWYGGQAQWGTISNAVFFDGGQIAGVRVSSTQAYSITSDAFYSQPILLHARYGHQATSQGSGFGVIFGGNCAVGGDVSGNNSVSTEYRSGTSVATNATNLSTGRTFGAAYSSVNNWFAVGGSTQVNSRDNTTEKVGWFTNTYTVSTNLSSGRFEIAACGNDVEATITGGVTNAGSQVNTRDKHLYSDDTNTVVNYLLTARAEQIAFSSRTVAYTCKGVLVGGTPVLTTEKYTYATDTSAFGTNFIKNNMEWDAGASCSSAGFAGGGGGNIYKLERMSFYDDTVYQTIAAAEARTSHSAYCDVQGGIN